MKRLFLLSAALVVASLGFAQKMEVKSHALTSGNKASKTLVKSTLPRLNVQVQAAQSQRANRVQRRSLANNVFYVPNGGLYMGWDKEGMGTAYSVYEHAPFTACTYKASSETGAWHINGQDTGLTGSEVVDEVLPGFVNYAPTYVVATDSFNIGMNNVFAWHSHNTSGYEEYVVCDNGLLGSDSICTMYPTDDHAAYFSNDGCYNNVASWGYMTSDNMFGTGSIEDLDEDSNSVVYKSVAFVQDYRPLDSPLYVEDIFVKGVSFRENPLGENDTLKAVVAISVDGDETYIDTLICTAADVTPFVADEYGRNEKSIYDGVITFTKREKDDFGTESTVPVVIPAGVPFAIYVMGFENDNIDFGAEGLRIPDEDVYDGSYMTGTTLATDGEKTYGFGFSANICVNMGITGIFDVLDVLDNTRFNNVPEGVVVNALRLSDDGKTCCTEGTAADDDMNLGAVLVGTGMKWFDGDGNENYSLESDDDMSWITWSLDDSFYTNSSSQFCGYNVIRCEAEALPAGVTGRRAVVYVSGHGVESAPFVVLQGDATMPDAIQGVKAETKTGNTRVYNLAGQQLGQNAKGLVIKNGKKVIVK